MAVLKVIQELLSTPSILVGLMALIGLCLQKNYVLRYVSKHYNGSFQ